MTNDSFRIVTRGSFSWPGVVSVLHNFEPLAHVWSGDESSLSLLADSDFTPVDVKLRFADGVLHGTVSKPALTRAIRKQVARIFSLDHDGTGWDDVPIARLYPGLRPVCFSSPYEAACWAVVSQRISKVQAGRIMASLVAEHGHFPTPAELRRIERVPGLASLKVERLRAVATAALDGALDADRLRALGDVDAPASLRRIPGIGPFWSSGIYLRACGIRDVFPAEPIAVAALARVFRLRASPTAAEIESVTDGFRPYRMWACFLLRVAEARGLLDTVSFAA